MRAARGTMAIVVVFVMVVSGMAYGALFALGTPVGPAVGSSGSDAGSTATPSLSLKPITALPHSLPLNGTASSGLGPGSDVYNSPSVPVSDLLAPNATAQPAASTTPIDQSYYSAVQNPRTPAASDGTTITLYNGPEPTNTPTTGIFTGKFTAPKEPTAGWGLILLNYTVTSTATNGSALYDVDYNVFFNGVTVLFGTLPEYGTANVVKNITEYESLLHGSVTWELRHPHDCEENSSDVESCQFNSTLTVTFYAPTAAFAAPNEPTQVLPLWNYTKINTTNPSNTTELTVPADTTSAVLEVYPYGYGDGASGATSDDEFWYSAAININAQGGVFRTAYISVDGSGTSGNHQGLAYILPFPYINTGGLDLFAWRPIPGTFTLDNQPDEINVTGALGTIEGTNNWTVTIQEGISVGSYWHVAGALLIYTSSAAVGAVQNEMIVPSTFSPTIYGPACEGNVSTEALCYYNTTASLSYYYTSTVNGVGGTTLETTSSSTNLNYVNDQLLLISGGYIIFDQINMESSTVQNDSLHTTVTTTVRTATLFPFTMAWGEYEVEGGSVTCPGGGSCTLLSIYDIMNDVSQTWNTTTQTWVLTGPNVGNYTYSYVNETTWVSTSNATELVALESSTEGYDLGYSSITAATTQYYTQNNLPTDPNHVYTGWVGANSMLVSGLYYYITDDLAQFINFQTSTRAVTSAYANRLVQEVSSLTSEVNSLAAQVSSLQNQVTLDRTEISSLNAELNSTRSFATNLSVALGTANGTISGLQSTVNTDKGTIANLTNEVAALNSKVSGYSGWVSASTATLYMIIAAVVAAAVVGAAMFFIMRRRMQPPEYEEYPAEGETGEYPQEGGEPAPEAEAAPAEAPPS